MTSTTKKQNSIYRNFPGYIGKLITFLRPDCNNSNCSRGKKCPFVSRRNIIHGEMYNKTNSRNMTKRSFATLCRSAEQRNCRHFLIKSCENSPFAPFVHFSEVISLSIPHSLPRRRCGPLSTEE